MIKTTETHPGFMVFYEDWEVTMLRVFFIRLSSLILTLLPFLPISVSPFYSFSFSRIDSPRARPLLNPHGLSHRVFRLRRTGHNPHQFNTSSVRIGHPRLPIAIAALVGLDVNRISRFMNLSDGRKDIIHLEAKMIEADQPVMPCIFLHTAIEKLQKLAAADAEIDNPGFAGFRPVQFKGFAKTECFCIETDRFIHIPDGNCVMRDSCDHKTVPVLSVSSRSRPALYPSSAPRQG